MYKTYEYNVKKNSTLFQDKFNDRSKSCRREIWYRLIDEKGIYFDKFIFFINRPHGLTNLLRVQA